MNRTVILTVDDRADHITVAQWRMSGVDSAECLSANVTHDVPPDDQLARDLAGLTGFAIGMAEMLEDRAPRHLEKAQLVRESVARIRAAAGLDDHE